MGEAKDLKPVLRLIGLSGPLVDAAPAITGVSFDSRSTASGDAFVCLPGEKVDGNQFVPDAVRAGAVCVFSEVEHEGLSVPLYRVPDVRLALALIADHFYGYPSQRIRPLGVTGTNGKTTTTHLIEHVMNSAGLPTGLIGTLGARWPGMSQYQNIKHTTPQSADLHRILAMMVESGATHAAMEVSSHALAQKRVAGCHFAVACLTNVTQDHLDYHQTMENYWQSKRKLFEMLNDSIHENKAIVVNIDDELSAEFIKAAGPSVRVLTYGFGPSADMRAESVSFTFDGVDLKLASPFGQLELSAGLAGRFNVYNIMAALLVCLSEGVGRQEAVDALTSFAGVSGRFETVRSGAENEPLCIVDYAHTPDGLKNVLDAARALVPPCGRLIAVFGCGGDRDSSKRPQMGAIAEQAADLVVVTSDNPRSEEPQQIIANILAGMRRVNKVHVEPDRAKAIRLALNLSCGDDIVVVAGKGHENYQILADRTIPFDDRTEVRLALKERGSAKTVAPERP